MPNWLYRTTSRQESTVDEDGNPLLKDTFEARVLGQVVYSVTTEGGAAPGAEDAGGAPSAPTEGAEGAVATADAAPAESAEGEAPAASAAEVAAEARAEVAAPEVVKVLAPKPKPAGKPATLADRIAHESHWLDVDRTADSRAESPELPEGADAKPAASAASAGDGGKRTVTNVGVLGFNVWGPGKKGEKGETEWEETGHWLDVDHVGDDSRADSPVHGDAAYAPNPVPAPAAARVTVPDEAEGRASPSTIPRGAVFGDVVDATPNSPRKKAMISSPLATAGLVG